MPRRSLSRRFDRECKPVRRLRRLTRGDAPPGELESGPFCGLQAIRLRRVVRTLGATPGSHPSQPETQGNPRFMADLVRTSVRRVRRVGSHLAELKEFCGLQAAVATGSRIFALSLAKYRAGPPYQYSPRKDPDVLNRKSIVLAVWTPDI
jgi:hypothetical protein